MLENVPVGHIQLHIDPSNSSRPETFPNLSFETVTVAGQINILGQPILLPTIQSESSKLVGGNADVTVKMPGVAGCQVTISQVQLDKVPMPPPSGTLFMPPAWTIQPAGTLFDPPAKISIPNDGLPPGRVIDIFQFDHTLNEFINIGKGTVSDDGLVIISDPGFGITRAGWGGCGQPQPPQTCTSSCDDSNRCTGDSCQNGSCVNTPMDTPQMVANMCEGCNNGTPVPKKTDAQCCAEKTINAGGWVVCCNGNKTACIGHSGTNSGDSDLIQCVREHEERHFQDVEACPTGANECDTAGPLGVPTSELPQVECDAYKAEDSCLRAANCAGNPTCQARVDGRRTQIKGVANGFVSGCIP